MQTGSADKPRIVALYGALRSGTTLFRLMIDANPKIHAPGERDCLLDHLVPTGDGFGFDHTAIELDRMFLATGLKVPQTGDGLAAFHDMVRQDSREDTVLVLILHRQLGRLLDIVPDIPVIHLIRDPRDVARSSIGMGWGGNTWFGIDHWLKTEQDWDRQAHRLASDQVLELRYEDLIHAPEEKLTGVCNFLDLPYDPVMLTSYTETSTYSAIDPALCYQWKRKQSEREVTLVEQKAGPLLQTRGYAPSGYAGEAPSLAERLSLWIESKIKTWRLLVERYGVLDPLMLRIANRIGVRGLARGPQLRMNAKAEKYLK